jgi:predicted dinucleotide-binding enzyme
MKIGIIGAGHIGATLARHFVDAGHEVAVSNSRGPETLTGLVEELGSGAQAMTAAEAARFGEEPGSPAYTEGLHTGELRARLAA